MNNKLINNHKKIIAVSIIFLIEKKSSKKWEFSLIYLELESDSDPRNGSSDPDPHQNEMDPQHWFSH